MANKKVLEQIKHCGNRDWRLVIEDTEKDLEILEEIRNYFKVIDYGEEYQNRYALQVGYPYPPGTIIPINKELFLKWSRWLNND